MGYQLRKIANEWKEYSVLINEYIRDVDAMKRAVSKLPSSAGEHSFEATAEAEDALRETERISALVDELSARVKLELRMRATEMRSFSPEEMATIPRKRECISRLLEQLICGSFIQ